MSRLSLGLVLVFCLLVGACTASHLPERVYQEGFLAGTRSAQQAPPPSLTAPPPPPKPKLARGQTMAQVMAIMGAPAEMTGNERYAIWAYVFSPEEISLFAFINGIYVQIVRTTERELAHLARQQQPLQRY